MKTKFVLLAVSLTLMTIIASALIISFSIDSEIKESQKAGYDGSNISDFNFECP